MQLHAGSSQSTAPSVVQAIVSDHGVDLIEFAEPSEGALAELAAVSDHNGLVRTAHHGSFRLDQQQVAVVVAAIVGARDAQHRLLHIQ